MGLVSVWRQVGSTRRGHLFAVLREGVGWRVFSSLSECGNARPPLALMPMTKRTVRCSVCARYERDGLREVLNGKA